MKTPCLKCGLIHDEPTAICDGYVGIDPDETAGDTRKKAAERIRALLATVPIESRRGGRARAAAAGASASPSSDAPQPVASRPEPPQPEVPEWRREVSERLESYRSRRERQRANNQSVLEFRVPSKTETPDAVAMAAAAPAAIEEPAAEPPASSPTPAEFAVAPTALDAAVDTVSPAAPKPAAAVAESLRTYQPVEEAELTEDLTADITELASHVSDDEETVRTTASKLAAAPEDEETVRTTASALGSAAAAETPAAIPIAAEPAVVLADSTTLEVHADAVELADVQPAEPAVEPAVTESVPLAAIPTIDTEYWHSTPGPEEEDAECGSLTSGYEPAAAAHEEAADAPPIAELAHEELLPVEETELAAVSEAPSPTPGAEAPSALPVEPEVPAVVAHSAPSAPGEAMFPPAIETESEEETSYRRAALRTASRPLQGTTPERIEIRVPQPVFDFSPNNVVIQQPQIEVLPVADLRERRCAAFLDAAILGLTIGAFFLAFHLAGGEFVFSRVGAAVSIAAAFLIYSQYVLLFTVVGGATPGMVLRGLRVVCFDGKTPVTAELAWRSFGYLLSAAAGMLGFLWSAWDDHGLSWHDRISQTYITYAEPEALPVVVTTH